MGVPAPPGNQWGEADLPPRQNYCAFGATVSVTVGPGTTTTSVEVGPGTGTPTTAVEVGPGTGTIIVSVASGAG